MKFLTALLAVIFIIGSLAVMPVSALIDATYTDEKGVSHEVIATVITKYTTVLTSEWYIAQGAVKTTNLRVEGSAKLILADGCVMTAEANNDNAGIELEHENFLTIYGQTLNTGKLMATGSGKGSGIGGSGGANSTYSSPGEIGGHCGDLTINGGNVFANRLGGGDGGKGTSQWGDYSTNSYGGNGGNGGIIVLNRGSLSVARNLGGGNGGHSTYGRGGSGGNINVITVSGGTLSAGSICGGNGGDGTFVFNGITNGVSVPIPVGIAGNGGSGGTINISGGLVDVIGNSFDITGNVGGGRAGYTSAISTKPGRGGNGSAVTIRGGIVSVSGIIGGGSGSPWLNSERGSDGSCVITGGSMTAALVLPVPTNGLANGNKAVYRTAVTLGGTANVNEAAILYLFTEPVYSYGTKDLFTGPDGEMTIWLPAGIAATKVYTADACYSGTVNSGTSGTLPETPPDTLKPIVKAVSPSKGAINVPVSGRIIVTFNEIMQASAGTVSLSSGGGSPVSLAGSGTWSLINTTYSVPYSGLTQGANYTITISGFMDLAGNINDVNTSYNFTTIPPIPMFEYSYIDEAGAAKTISAYKLDDSYHTLTSGWYAAEGTLNFSNITISGDVKLILTDGCKLNFNGTGANAALRVKNGNSLAIFGQSLGTGTLTAGAAGRGAGIGGNGGVGSPYDTSKAIGETCGTIRIYGGNVIADHIGGGDGDDLVGFSAGKGGSGGSVIINGGTVTVSSRIGGGDGGDGATFGIAGGDGGDGSVLTINGGTVTVSGKVGGGDPGTGVSSVLHLPAKAGAAGSCTITGGSVKVTSMQPTPRNGSANGNLVLSRTTVTLAGTSAGLPVKAIVTNRTEIYGTRDMKTDTNSILYIWLPSGALVSEAYAQGNRYVGTVLSSTSGTLALAAPDTADPVIVTSTPASGETDVQPAGNISVTFSKVMDISRGSVTLSADGADPFVLTGGVWTHSGTVFTVHYSDLSYRSEYTIIFDGFRDISGIGMDSTDSTFSTVIHPKTIIVSLQEGEPVSTSAGSVSYMVSTISIDMGAVITLNNINDIGGISVDTLETSGDITIVTIKTTEETPAGTHPLTLTIDGITSGQFGLIVEEAVRSISLSQTGIYYFPEPEAGYAPVDEHMVTVTNTGNLPSGTISLSLTGEGSSSFILSANEISDIAYAGSNSFGVRPADGLEAGTYSATLTLSGSEITPQSFGVSFTVNKRSGNIVSGVIFPLDATIRNTSIYVIVESDVTIQPIDFTVSEGASWKLYSDIACTDEIIDKNMMLEYGPNMAFAVVTAENGTTKLYAISVMRMEGALLGNPQTGDSAGAFTFTFPLILVLVFALSAFCRKSRGLLRASSKPCSQ